MSGLIYDARGDRPTARTHYEQALARNPKAAVAANNLAWIYAADGRWDEALSLAKNAQSILREPEVEHTLGWIYLNRDRPAQAIASFEQAIAKRPQKALYHYHFGLALIKQGHSSEAAARLRRALALGLSENDAVNAEAALRSL